MTPQMIAGFFLAALGAVILFGGFESRAPSTQASVEQRRTIPLWVGGSALAGGVLLVVIGVGMRRRLYAA